MSEPFRVPPPHRVFDVLADAYGATESSLSGSKHSSNGRAVRRYRRDGTGSRDLEMKLWSALAAQIAREDFLPPDQRGHLLDAAGWRTTTLQLHDAWTRLSGALRSLPAVSLFTPEVAVTYLRLPLADIALRIAVARHGLGLGALGEPTWASPTCFRAVLARYFSAYRNGPPKRAALAKALDVRFESVDAWLEGTEGDAGQREMSLPSDENLDLLAKHIAANVTVDASITEPAAHIHAQLWRARFLVRLAATLRPFVSQSNLDELAKAFTHLINHFRAAAAQARVPREIGETIIIHGSEARAGRDLVARCQASLVAPPEWKAVLEAMTTDWSSYLMNAAASLSELERRVREGTLVPKENDSLDHLVRRLVHRHEYEALSPDTEPPTPEQLADRAWALGDPTEASRHYAAAIETAPESAALRMARAGTLAQTKAFAAARAELVRALELDPHNEQALVGIAFMDTQLGRPKDALETLRSLYEAGSYEPALCTTVAEAYLQLGKATRALQAAIRVLTGSAAEIKTLEELQDSVSLDGASPTALELAAQCALGAAMMARQQDNGAGARRFGNMAHWLAREASKRGCPGTQRVIDIGLHL